MKHLGFPDPAPQLIQSALPLGTHIKEIDLIMATIFTKADSISGCAVPLAGGGGYTRWGKSNDDDVSPWGTDAHPGGPAPCAPCAGRPLALYPDNIYHVLSWD